MILCKVFVPIVIDYTMLAKVVVTSIAKISSQFFTLMANGNSHIMNR
jgi:hypothetical protein